jgi:phosphatidylglycerophosphate synthase
MLVAKQVADFLTLTRALLVWVLIWLGTTQGAEALPAAALLLMLSWTTDALDGPIARRSRRQYHTWLGDHDLQIDMAVSVGLLGYMILSDYVKPLLGVAYALAWALAFLHWGVQRSPGMLFQAPIYAWFIWLALTQASFYGALVVGWILGVILLTWPRALEEVIPGFLAGMRALGDRHKS